MGMIVLLPRLLAALLERAPLAALKPIQAPSLELASALQDGAVDLAIGYLGKLGENLHQQPLFLRSLVGIIKGRATRRKPRMTLEDFVEKKHVVAGTLALANQLLEKELRRHGARLKVGVEVPYLLTVPSLVANTDFIAAVPDELADLFSRLADVDVFPLPIKLPDLLVRQFWYAREQLVRADPAPGAVMCIIFPDLKRPLELVGKGDKDWYLPPRKCWPNLDATGANAARPPGMRPRRSCCRWANP